MISKAKMEQSLKGLGFKRTRKEENNSFSLAVDRGDGVRLCTIFVYLFYSDSGYKHPDHWEMSIVYMATDDFKHSSDHVCRISGQEEVIKVLIFWAMEKGRHDMKSEILSCLADCSRNIYRFPDAPTVDLLKSAVEE